MTYIIYLWRIRIPIKMTNQPILTSRTIGIAENALRAVLLKALAGTGLDYHGWVALKTVADRDPRLSVRAAVRRLSDALKLDEPTAVGVIEALNAHGLVEQTDDSLSPTPKGAALYQRLDHDTRQLGRHLYAGLEAADLAVAHRVLSTLTERANALLADPERQEMTE